MAPAESLSGSRDSLSTWRWRRAWYTSQTFARSWGTPAGARGSSLALRSAVAPPQAASATRSAEARRATGSGPRLMVDHTGDLLLGRSWTGLGGTGAPYYCTTIVPALAAPLTAYTEPCKLPA
jgi:hypothetical protein